MATVKIDFQEYELQAGQLVDAPYIRKLAELAKSNNIVMVYDDDDLGKIEVAMLDDDRGRISVAVLDGMRFHTSANRTIEQMMAVYTAGGSKRQLDAEFERYMADLLAECAAAEDKPF